jgi:hypothetical protein
VTPPRALHLLVGALLHGAACSAGPGQEAADASPDASADAGADADPSPPCPGSLPAGACSAAAQTCFYGLVDNGHHANRCDCVAPEMKWLCCNVDTVFACDGPETTPVGSMCCPDSVNLPAAPRGCSYCYPDGREVDLSCAPGDFHWRETDTTCVYAPPRCADGGLAGADAGDPCVDSGPSDSGSPARPRIRAGP